MIELVSVDTRIPYYTESVVQLSLMILSQVGQSHILLSRQIVSGFAGVCPLSILCHWVSLHCDLLCPPRPDDEHWCP